MVAQTKSILVIDDNDDIRGLLSLVLQKEGYEVLEAAGGSEALIKINESKPDLILLDVMMPGLSGLEVLATIRESREKKISEVPVIMITAKSTIDDIDAAIELGANSYIVKPFRPANLVEKVSEIFQAALNN
jgi:DNA-binding response OmpR family regulator